MDLHVIYTEYNTLFWLAMIHGVYLHMMCSLDENISTTTDKINGFQMKM